VTNKINLAVTIYGLLIFITLGTINIILEPISVSAIGPKQEDLVASVAPGHLKSSDEGTDNSASSFAPGIIQNSFPGGGDAPDFAPGHVFDIGPKQEDLVASVAPGLGEAMLQTLLQVMYLI
jgi:hypothetical protein